MVVLTAILTLVDVAATQQFVHLAVGYDRLTETLGLLHRTQHILVTLHPATIVRETDDRRGHRRHFGRLATTLLSHRDATVGDHLNDGIPFDEVELLLEVGSRVGCGVEVGHGTDGGITATSRRRRTGGNGLLVAKARLTQVDVDIDQTRHHDGTRQIDHFVTHFGDRGIDHNSLLHNDCALLYATIDQATAIDIELLHCRLQKRATAQQLPY